MGTPFETFKSAGANVRSSLVFLKKKSNKEDQPKEVFFAKANYVGFDNSGKETKENDFPLISKYYRKNIESGKIVNITPAIFKYPYSRLEDNLTAEYYAQKLIENNNELFDEVGKFVEYRQDTFSPQKNPDILFKTVSIHFDGTMSLREEKLGSEFKYTNQYIMKKGDIVLSRIDCSHGAVAVVPEELNGAVCSGEFYVLMVKGTDPMVLWYLLRNKQTSEQMIGLSSGMTGRHRLSREQLLKIKIPKLKELVAKEFIRKMKKVLELQNQINSLKKEALALLD